MKKENITSLVTVLQDIQTELHHISDSLHTLAHHPPITDQSLSGMEEKLRRIAGFLEDISYRR
ncbi:hypothetical protein JQK62_19800 [Leptospira santarosai]|nr:hypothetical protein [Leptospira santarosai]